MRISGRESGGGGVINTNFSEYFAYVLNGWSLLVMDLTLVSWKNKMLLSPIFGFETLNFTKGKFTGHELGVYYKKHSRAKSLLSRKITLNKFYVFEKFLRTTVIQSTLGDCLWSKRNIHHYTLASILSCSCRENDPLKGNFGDKFLGFLAKTFIKVSKNILSIHGKAHW